MSIERGFKLGDWKAVCYRCGTTKMASDLWKQWQGYYVCQEHWEPRHPQDFVKGITEKPAAPWSQPDNWAPVTVCTYQGSSAMPGLSVPGCMTPGKRIVILS
jgi:hypothetical protein